MAWGVWVHGSTWESRGSDRESTFRPNVKNIAPRPANWKKDSAPPVSF